MTNEQGTGLFFREPRVQRARETNETFIIKYENFNVTWDSIEAPRRVHLTQALGKVASL